MSNWTHVAAIARIDAFDYEDFNAKEVFGKECLFESDDEEWDNAEKNPNKYLPMGSEGSLRMSVWINPHYCAISKYTVSIFGDLRDHEDPHKIVTWFQEKLKNLMVRQATITVENERNGTLDWTYVYSEEE